MRLSLRGHIGPGQATRFWPPGGLRPSFCVRRQHPSTVIEGWLHARGAVAHRDSRGRKTVRHIRYEGKSGIKYNNPWMRAATSTTATGTKRPAIGIIIRCCALISPGNQAGAAVRAAFRVVRPPDRQGLKPHPRGRHRESSPVLVRRDPGATTRFGAVRWWSFEHRERAT